MWTRKAVLMADLISKIQSDVVRTYGDLENPTYHKIAESLRSGPMYSELRGIISRHFVREDTDANNDCCFSFLINVSEGLLRLEMSVVGMYFCLFLLRDEYTEVLDESYLRQNTALYDAFSSLLSHRTMLEQKQLEQIVNLNTEDAENGKSIIYNALFSTSGLPWKQQI